MLAFVGAIAVVALMLSDRLEITVAIAAQLRAYLFGADPALKETSTPAAHPAKDLALFSIVALVFGVGGYTCFLLKLQFPTEPWYYMEMLSLCAISLEAVLTASWPRLRPWGLLRIGLAVVMLTCASHSMWKEAHTRRSNMDLIATVLASKADPEDLIVVQGAWEALTWDRYYQGRARWLTVPLIESNKVHRTELMWQAMNRQDAIGPLLEDITNTLRNDKAVWVVGQLAPGRPRPLAPAEGSGRKWLGGCMWNWSAQLSEHLSNRALETKRLQIAVDGPVSVFENLPLTRFRGCRNAHGPGPGQGRTQLRLLAEASPMPQGL